MTESADSVCGKTGIRREMGSALAELAWGDGAQPVQQVASRSARRPDARFVGSIRAVSGRFLLTDDRGGLQPVRSRQHYRVAQISRRLARRDTMRVFQLPCRVSRLYVATGVRNSRLGRSGNSRVRHRAMRTACHEWNSLIRGRLSSSKRLYSAHPARQTEPDSCVFAE
jgi:hypothetical protein